MVLVGLVTGTLNVVLVFYSCDICINCLFPVISLLPPLALWNRADNLDRWPWIDCKRSRRYFTKELGTRQLMGIHFTS
jgi:hypothetical protein